MTNLYESLCVEVWVEARRDLYAVLKTLDGTAWDNHVAVARDRLCAAINMLLIAEERTTASQKPFPYPPAQKIDEGAF